MTSPRGESNYNSIIERSIQTKLNMAFAMLDASPLSSTGWNLAMAHATFIQARCPRRSNQGNITPYEQFFNVKPDLSSLRVFGSICYFHIPKDQRTIFQAHAQRGIFVGYK